MLTVPNTKVSYAFKKDDFSVRGTLIEAYPTLLYKWRNVDDSLSLLDYAGVILTKPDLTLSKAPREDAITFLGDVQDELEKILLSFGDSLQTFAKNLGDFGTFGEKKVTKEEVISLTNLNEDINIEE